MTSLVDLGLPVSLPDLDLALQQTFDAVFAGYHAPADEI